MFDHPIVSPHAVGSVVTKNGITQFNYKEPNARMRLFMRVGNVCIRAETYDLCILDQVLRVAPTEVSICTKLLREQGVRPYYSNRQGYIGYSKIERIKG